MSKKGLYFLIEIIWIFIFVIIATIILFPVYKQTPNFPYLIPNFIFIFITLFLMRYIVFIKKTIISKKRLLLKILFFLSIPIVLLLADQYFTVLAYFKEFGFEFIPDSFSYLDSRTLGNYVKTEINFFGISSIITAVIFPFRILFYLWKTSNNKLR